MNEKIIEALKNIIKETRLLIKEKYGKRKRLTQDEIFREATLYRDIVEVEKLINNPSGLEEIAMTQKEKKGSKIL